MKKNTKNNRKEMQEFLQNDENNYRDTKHEKYNLKITTRHTKQPQTAEPDTALRR